MRSCAVAGSTKTASMPRRIAFKNRASTRTSLLLDVKHQQLRSIPAVDQCVAGLAQQVRNVDAGQRIGALDHELLARGHARKRFFGLQRRERTFQPTQIEADFGHRGSIAESYGIARWGRARSR